MANGADELAAAPRCFPLLSEAAEIARIPPLRQRAPARARGTPVRLGRAGGGTRRLEGIILDAPQRDGGSAT